MHKTTIDNKDKDNTDPGAQTTSPSGTENARANLVIHLFATHLSEWNNWPLSKDKAKTIFFQMMQLEEFDETNGDQSHSPQIELIFLYLSLFSSGDVLTTLTDEQMADDYSEIVAREHQLNTDIEYTYTEMAMECISMGTIVNKLKNDAIKTAHYIFQHAYYVIQNKI